MIDTQGIRVERFIRKILEISETGLQFPTSPKPEHKHPKLISVFAKLISTLPSLLTVIFSTMLPCTVSRLIIYLVQQQYAVTTISSGQPITKRIAPMSVAYNMVRRRRRDIQFTIWDLRLTSGCAQFEIMDFPASHIPPRARCGSGGSHPRPPASAAGNGYTLQAHCFRRQSHIPRRDQKLLHGSAPVWDAAGIVRAIHIPWPSEKWNGCRARPVLNRYRV